MHRTCTVLIAAIFLMTGCLSKEEAKQKAEEKAQFMAEKKARTIKGIGEAMKKEGRDAMESVSEGAGEIIKGGKTGFDKSLKAVKVEVDSGIAAKGLEIGRAARLNDPKKKNGVTVYIIFNKAYKGRLLLKAADQSGTEIGRSAINISGKPDSSQYVNFYFDEKAPIDIAGKYYLLEKK